MKSALLDGTIEAGLEFNTKKNPRYMLISQKQNGQNNNIQYENN